MKQEGGSEGTSADLVPEVSDGFLHSRFREGRCEIGVAHAFPVHLRPHHALSVSAPIIHGITPYGIYVIRFDANPVDLLGLDHHIRCERNALEGESQHFLLSARARTLVLKRVARMSEEEAEDAFVSLRYVENGGEPFCHHCGCAVAYRIIRQVKNRKTGACRPRRLFKCANCLKQFSSTAGTVFAGRKLAHRDLLFAIALFVNGAKGISALQLGRDLNVQAKTAFVLLHKLREVMGAVQHAHTIAGDVEIDGAYFGGYVKPSTRKEHRRDRRKLENQTGKRRCVTIMRERNGRSRPFVCSELEGAEMVPYVVDLANSRLFADEAKDYDGLEPLLVVQRINHSKSYAEGEVSTNQAESFFSRLRRAEQGVHHRIAVHLDGYANEMSWREDNRRRPNGEQFLHITAAGLHSPVSRRWKGYWQRRKVV